MSSNSSQAPLTSSTEMIEMPDSVPSSVVAIATVVCVAGFLVVIIGLLYYFRDTLRSTQSCSERNIRKKSQDKNVVTVPRDAVEDDEDKPEMLREDSVVIHDVIFPEDAYFSGNQLSQRPQPSPSIFKDDFLQEVIAGCDEVFSPRKEEQTRHVNDVQEIIEDVLDKATGQTEEEEDSQTPEPLRLRSSSYKKALKKVHDYESTERFPQRHDIDGYPFTSFTSSSSYFSNNESNQTRSTDVEEISSPVMITSLENQNISIDIDFDESVQETKVDDNDLNVCHEVDEGMLLGAVNTSTFPSSCKWQSTPVLPDHQSEDDDHERLDIGLHNNDEEEPAVLKVSRSYSPVYKMSFNSSFANITRHNYSGFDDRNDK